MKRKEWKGREWKEGKEKEKDREVILRKSVRCSVVLPRKKGMLPKRESGGRHTRKGRVGRS